VGNGIPMKCPKCRTEDGTWAYGRLVFNGEPNPTCAICNGPILPSVAAAVPNDLTTENVGVDSPSVAPLLPADIDRGRHEATSTNRVVESRGKLTTGVVE
jgi:hypothetical protein